MNIEDQKFYAQFLMTYAIKFYETGFLEKECKKKNIVICNTTMVKWKPMFEQAFFIEAEIEEPMKSFMERNNLTVKDISRDLFKSIWAIFEEMHNLVM